MSCRRADLLTQLGGLKKDTVGIIFPSFGQPAFDLDFIDYEPQEQEHDEEYNPDVDVLEGDTDDDDDDEDVLRFDASGDREVAPRGTSKRRN